MGRPLNAIVPDEYANVRLPALEMKNVNVPQLFNALAAASRKSEPLPSSSPAFVPGYLPGLSQSATTSYGFRTESGVAITDDSIWCFYVEKPVLAPPSSPAKVCRFYSLAPYLERGATVDDITTAIETGWKMLGDTSPPAIRFHKDTKLLIAVGEPGKLEIIDAVLKALEGSKPKPKPLVPAPAAKPAEGPKTKE
jgi:hypothetical protein